MATLEQLEAALRAADAAGNAEDAQALAQEYARVRSSQAPKAPAEVRWAGGVAPSTDPTEGMSGYQRFMAGAGKSVADTGLGLRQLFGAADEQEVAARRAQDAPLMDTGAGAIGNVAGQVAQMAVPVGGGARLASVAGRAAPFVSAAARSAAFTGAQPMAAGEDRGTEALKSGALGIAGQGIASGLGRVGRGIVASKPAQELMAAAQRAGIRLTPAQLTDSNFVRTLSSALNKLPGSGAQKVAKAQRADFNRAVSRTFGEDAPAITDEVYAAAKGRIGGDFERLTARNELPLGPEVTSGLREVGDEARRFAGGDVEKAVTSAIDEVLAKSANGVLPGRAYQSLDSRLGKIMKAGGEKSVFVGQLRDVLREGMDKSISAGDRAAWGSARAQYKNLKTVRDLVAKGGDEGISPSQLMGRVNATGAGKEAMASGRGGALGELAKLGQKIKDPIPDSGTAQRLLAYMALGGGSGYAAQSDNPLLSTAGRLTLAGMVAGRALNSPGAARLLTQGNAPLRALAKVGKVAPKLLPAAASPGLVLDISGGTPGEPITEEELEALRRAGY